jgi:hypothetical protein
MKGWLNDHRSYRTREPPAGALRRSRTLLVKSPLGTISIDRETDVVSIEGPPIGPGAAWRVELNPDEVSLKQQIDQRLKKVQTDYEALTPEQQKRLGALLLGACASNGRLGPALRERLIARVKAESESTSPDQPRPSKGRFSRAGPYLTNPHIDTPSN